MMTDQPDTPEPEDGAKAEEPAAGETPAAAPAVEPPPSRVSGAGVVGLAAALALLWGFASMVGPPWLFFDLPSIVFVVGWAVATGVMTHGWAGLGAGMRGLGVLFVGPGPAGFPGPAVLRSLRRGLYAGGGLGVVIGVVQMLANLADPAAIGPGLGAALFSLFTALVLAELLCRPALERLEAMDAVAGGPTLGSNPGPD